MKETSSGYLVQPKDEKESFRHKIELEGGRKSKNYMKNDVSYAERLLSLINRLLKSQNPKMST